MKLRTTTPASLSLAARVTIGFVAVLLMLAVPIQMIQQPASADKYDDAINALQGEINSYNNKISDLQDQADTYQAAVEKLQAEAATIQAQIDISQAKHDQLVVKIADTEKQIKLTQDVLGDTIAELYVADQVSPLEMLASSENISEYLDQQEYQSSVRDELTAKISEIRTLKAELEKQKTEVARVLGDQQNSKNALQAKQAEQQQLVNETKGQEATYQSLVSTNKAKQEQLREQQQAAIAAAIAASGGATIIEGGAAPNYPWNNSNCPMVGYFSTQGSDGNGGDGYGYGCRQCVSYVAWRVAKETGNYPYRWGDAIDVPASANVSGYTNQGSTPKAGSIAVMTSNGRPGHVAWVDAVNDDGTLVVSQYNYNYGSGWGMYSKMILSADVFQWYVYIL
jgi:surface antigen/peptidoglycan hydrolase CwlO-like protein